MDKIKLTFINGKTFCFNSTDYFKIRYDHRVIGNLIGPGVGNPGNHDYKSLPALFTDIETQFLIETGVADVFEKPNLLVAPSKTTKIRFQNEFERQSTEMKSFEDEKSKAVFKANIQQVFEGQMKSIERKKKKNEDCNPKSIEELIKEHEERLANTPVPNRLVHIPTSDPFDMGNDELKDVQAKNQLKYRVYKDLYERGHTITCGETFSGDFLCYPGDPLHFHASHIVIIVETEREIDETEMILHGRTSVSVKKGCLFAREGVNGAITYQTMRWVNPEETKELQNESQNQDVT